MSEQTPVKELSQNTPTPQPPAKKKKASTFKPPFDLFGMQTSFFISGEDKTVTWLGFISTIILVSVIIGISIFYVVIFFRNHQSKVYINDILLDNPPNIKIDNSNFLLMFKHNYPTSKQLSGQQDKIFRLKLNLATEGPETVIPNFTNRYLQASVPCKDLKLNLDGVNVSQEDVDSSLCYDLPKDTNFGGSYKKRELVSIFDIFVSPCDPVNPGDCEVLYDGNAVSAVATADIATEYFLVYTLEVFILESSHDVKNFEKPLTKNMRKIVYKFNSSKLYFTKNKISQVKTLTSSGTFSSKNRAEEGFMWQTQVTTFQSISPLSRVPIMYGGNFAPPEPVPYGIIQFQLTNQVLDVTRIYPTAVTVFQRIGGVAQIFMFVFVYLMIYNNEVIIELYMLNFGVLMIAQQGQAEDSTKPNQVADVSMK